MHNNMRRQASLLAWVFGTGQQQCKKDNQSLVRQWVFRYFIMKTTSEGMQINNWHLLDVGHALYLMFIFYIYIVLYIVYIYTYCRCCVSYTQPLNCKHKSKLQFNSVQFNSVQFNSIQCNSIQFNSIQFSAIQFSLIQFNSVQFNSHLITVLMFDRTDTICTTIRDGAFRTASTAMAVLDFKVMRPIMVMAVPLLEE